MTFSNFINENFLFEKTGKAAIVKALKQNSISDFSYDLNYIKTNNTFEIKANDKDIANRIARSLSRFDDLDIETRYEKVYLRYNY